MLQLVLKKSCLEFDCFKNVNQINGAVVSPFHCGVIVLPLLFHSDGHLSLQWHL